MKKTLALETEAEIAAAVKLGMPREWAKTALFRWSTRAMLAWACFALAMPMDLLACACTEMVLASTGGRSSLAVDPEPGDFTLTQEDISIPGITPISLIRDYAGRSNSFTLFGYGWAWTSLSYIDSIEADQVVIVNGSTVETYKSVNDWYNLTGEKKLSFVGADTVKVEEKAGTIRMYDRESGTLSWTRDANQNQTTWTWKTVDKPVGWNGEIQTIRCPLTVTWPCGRQLTFAYEDPQYEYLCTKVNCPDDTWVQYGYTNGLLTQVTRESGKTLHYDYRIGVSTPASSSSSSPPPSEHGDAASFRSMTLISSGSATIIKGWLTQITYASGANVNIVWNGNYDTPSELRVVSITGPHNYQHTFQYQDMGNDETLAEITDSNGHTTSYTYQKFNESTGRTTTLIDALGNTLTNVVNVLGNTTSKTWKNGSQTMSVYDAENTDQMARSNRVQVINQLGKITQMAYDSANNLTSVTDPMNRTWTFGYDSNHNLSSMTNSLEETILGMTYTTNGLLASISDGRNNQTTYIYTTEGYLSKTTDALANEWNYVYNASGQRTSITTPLGFTTQMTYLGNKFSSITNPLGQITTMEYDEMANLTSKTDANGNTVMLTYDLFQRPLTRTNALDNTTTFAYDAEGNPLTITDALGRTYSYTYDAMNRATAFVLPDVTNNQFEYDLMGNMIRSIDRAGRAKNFIYAANGKLLSQTWEGAGTGGQDRVFTYSYNDADQVTSIAEGETTQITRTYDGAARLSSETVSGLAVSFGYDGSQNINSVTYPSGTVAGYVYDARNQLSQIKQNNSLIIQLSHDADGRVVKKELGNGLEEIYTYDAASRLTQMELRSIQNPANVLLHHNYGYDAVGNRIYTQYLDGTGDVYAYDATYQVIGVKYGVANPTVGYAAATGASRTVTYGYDAVGNRTSVLDGTATTTYATNNLNQYTSVGGVNYSYAASGELSGDGAWSYSYDYAGKLVGASKTGMNISYGYDPSGHRISKTVNGLIRTCLKLNQMG
jgi:YD repeat-containing protein